MATKKLGRGTTMKWVLCIFCLVAALPFVHGGSVGVVNATSQSDLFFAQNANNGTIYSIAQSGGYSVPFGNTTNNCLPIGLVPAASLGGIVVTCWDIHSLQMVPLPQGGTASNYTQLPSSCSPEQDLLASDGNLYVACDSSNDLLKVSTAAPHTVTTVVNLGTADSCLRPQGLLPDPSNPARIIVSCFSSDKLVSVLGTAVSDYASMPTGCGPIGITFDPQGHLFTVCNTSNQVYRNTFANGSPQQATTYASLPPGVSINCDGWGITPLTTGPYPGDLVVSCRGPDGIVRVPITAQLPTSAIFFSTDNPQISADFVSPIIDTTPPTFPVSKQLSTFNIGTNGLSLVWSAAEDDVGVTGYRVYEGSTVLANLTSDSRLYSVTGLQAGTSYTFSVQAGDAANNWSTDGPVLTITTASQPNALLASVQWIALILGAIGAALSILLFLRAKPTKT